MTLLDTQAPVHGWVDADGRFAQGDDRLVKLNARAGGAVGAPLAVPQLATLARLARRLMVRVSRSVLVADGDRDLHLWVMADPSPEGVRLALTGWKPERGWTPADARARSAAFLQIEADWTWTTDAALRLTMLSPGLATRHGIDPTELLGKSLTALFALDEDKGGELPILAAVAQRRAFERQPARLRATGESLLIGAVPLTDGAGGYAGLSGGAFLPEPADNAPAEPPDAFSRRLDRALRAPLGRIIANADSIHARTEGPLRQDYADYAADISSAGRHLLGLVDDLVDLQAIERPDFHVDAEPIDLADLGRRAAGLLAIRAQERGVRIDRPEPVDATPATGEFRRALQVLVNLVGNAVRYSPDGGMVWIRTERIDDMVAVIVADQGKGIAPEDQARIFDKFERVDASEPGGSGLGLYIARRLARAMGGDLTVDSAPGMGARFVFTLPAG